MDVVDVPQPTHGPNHKLVVMWTIAAGVMESLMRFDNIREEAKALKVAAEEKLDSISAMEPSR